MNPINRQWLGLHPLVPAFSHSSIQSHFRRNCTYLSFQCNFSSGEVQVSLSSHFRFLLYLEKTNKNL